MGTTEIIIVFSALMALIALVTIGIDWIGRPLRNRRFIPRIFRFDDEKLPIDEYGNTDFAPTGSTGPGGPAVYVPTMAGYAQPPDPAAASPTAVPSRQPAPRRVAEVPATPAAAVVPAAAAAATAAHGSTSAFSDTLAAPEPNGEGVAEVSHTSQDVATVRADPVPRVQQWRPDMPLDTTIDDRKPNLATKAERFWKATAASLTESHFDDADHERMSAGKAPRRKNPRNGRIETMQLTGLRAASEHTEVRMNWPDESVDPWNAR